MTKKSFNLAQDAIEQKRYKKAFRIYLKSMKNGDIDCELNIGYFYDKGIGIRKNKKKAAYHYKNCADRGDPAGANNLAILYKENKKYRLAERYFNLAIILGDKDAALEIAEIHIKNGDISSAKIYLLLVIKAADNEVTPASRNAASNILKTINKNSIIRR
ncbi:tetratricopeptide repeat protein [Delftia tsuruhatensis]|uniref:tetratricopeptide repeat protein n=1 Tax=Delftia tsuruhatensis TaxID=180282 RepID=UPI001F47F33C|nr:tetratricopeptide repeat protein [Delftia tsuruhatensis]